jgi:hypothetical protein
MGRLVSNSFNRPLPLSISLPPASSLPKALAELSIGAHGFEEVRGALRGDWMGGDLTPGEKDRRPGENERLPSTLEIS